MLRTLSRRLHKGQELVGIRYLERQTVLEIAGIGSCRTSLAGGKLRMLRCVKNARDGSALQFGPTGRECSKEAHG